MLILSNEDAEALLTMPDCIAALEEAYREQARDEAVNAARSDAVTSTGRPDTVAGLDVSRAPSLAQLVAGTAQGRSAAGEKTCFVNLPGTGLQFAAAGAAFYRKALAAGRGRELPTEWFTEDVVP